MNQIPDRRAALGLLARSPAGLLAERFAQLQPLPAWHWLRRPETGTLMLRARIGGDGAQFNLGEATLTRCTLRLADGTVGVGTVRGRNPQQAEQIALCDALLQHPAHAEQVQTDIIAVLAQAESERRARRAAEIAASKVDFFTLVRGED